MKTSELTTFILTIRRIIILTCASQRPRNIHRVNGRKEQGTCLRRGSFSLFWFDCFGTARCSWWLPTQPWDYDFRQAGSSPSVGFRFSSLSIWRPCAGCHARCNTNVACSLVMICMDVLMLAPDVDASHHSGVTSVEGSRVGRQADALQKV